MRLYRYIVPGLVIQAVLVGGGYATGRELVEFFLARGPRTALAGLALTALWFSAGSMVAFELARRYRAFDYKSFCRIFLGRFWVLFEIGYYALLLLVLSVLSAAAGKLLAQLLGLPELLDSILFMALVAFVVFFGNKVIEKVISAWSILFYATYGSMFALVVWKFSPQLHAALDGTSLDWAAALRDSFSYLGYNVVIVPILIFVARNFQSRAQAFSAGALAGTSHPPARVCLAVRFGGVLPGDSQRAAADFRRAHPDREPDALPLRADRDPRRLRENRRGPVARAE